MCTTWHRDKGFRGKKGWHLYIQPFPLPVRWAPLWSKVATSVLYLNQRKLNLLIITSNSFTRDSWELSHGNWLEKRKSNVVSDRSFWPRFILKTSVFFLKEIKSLDETLLSQSVLGPLLISHLWYFGKRYLVISELRRGAKTLKRKHSLIAPVRPTFVQISSFKITHFKGFASVYSAKVFPTFRPWTRCCLLAVPKLKKNTAVQFIYLILSCRSIYYSNKFISQIYLLGI